MSKQIFIICKIRRFYIFSSQDTNKTQTEKYLKTFNKKYSNALSSQYGFSLNYNINPALDYGKQF